MANHVLPFYNIKLIHCDEGLHKHRVPNFCLKSSFCSHFFHSHTAVTHQNMHFNKFSSWEILQQSHTCSSKYVTQSRPFMDSINICHQHMSSAYVFQRNFLKFLQLVKHSHILSDPVIILSLRQHCHSTDFFNFP